MSAVIFCSTAVEAVAGSASLNRVGKPRLGRFNSAASSLFTTRNNCQTFVCRSYGFPFLLVCSHYIEAQTYSLLHCRFHLRQNDFYKASLFLLYTAVGSNDCAIHDSLVGYCCPCRQDSRARMVVPTFYSGAFRWLQLPKAISQAAFYPHPLPPQFL